VGHNLLPGRRPRKCPARAGACGRDGCIEAFLSVRDSPRSLLATGEARAPADIAARAEAGDRGCALTLERYEGRLARALASVINLPRSRVIVLGRRAFRDRSAWSRNVPRAGGVTSTRTACDRLVRRPTTRAGCAERRAVVYPVRSWPHSSHMHAVNGPCAPRTISESMSAVREGPRHEVDRTRQLPSSERARAQASPCEGRCGARPIWRRAFPQEAHGWPAVSGLEARPVSPFGDRCECARHADGIRAPSPRRLERSPAPFQSRSATAARRSGKRASRPTSGSRDCGGDFRFFARPPRSCTASLRRVRRKRATRSASTFGRSPARWART